MSTIYRHHERTDVEHGVRQLAYDHGWTHAAYVDAYGPTTDTEPPGHVTPELRDVWDDGYREGVNAYEADLEDAEMYGHDWHDWHDES